MGSSLSSARFGLETPRVFTPPARRLTRKTSLGFDLVDFAAEVLEIPLLPWQKWLAIHALELLPDGTPRFRVVILLVARQNGKSTFLQILALFFLYVRGVDLVIGTAQKLDLAEEVWQGAVDMAKGVPDLDAEIEDVVMTNGKKALVLRHGERYKVEAANRRGGRGLSGDLVMLDELREHQNWNAWSAITKTTMARPLAQVWGASNAGDANSAVLGHLRTTAHAALGNPDNLPQPPPIEFDLDDDDDLAIFEWSAEPDCRLDDRLGWQQANPSLGHRVPERAITSAIRTDPEPEFRTEVLCQWVTSYHEMVIPMPSWLACLGTKTAFQGAPTVALDVSPDRSTASIAVAGVRPDGLGHVEIVENGAGTDWIVPRLRALQVRPARILVDPAGPGGSLIAEAASQGVVIEPVTVADHAKACGLLFDLVMQGRMRHLGDPLLERALAGAVKRDMGDGAWLWSRKNSLVDISPLVAATIALWAATPGPKPPADFFTI